jgi:V/A-type H+-transporting ATPase subunit B
VLEVHRDLAVIQILQGTVGMDATGTRVEFTGEPLRIPVGTGWLGRVCNGRGEPADGGPPVFSPGSRPSPGTHSTRPAERPGPSP